MDKKKILRQIGLLIVLIIVLYSFLLKIFVDGPDGSDGFDGSGGGLSMQHLWETFYDFFAEGCGIIVLFGTVIGKCFIKMICVLYDGDVFLSNTHIVAADNLYQIFLDLVDIVTRHGQRNRAAMELLKLQNQAKILLNLLDGDLAHALRWDLLSLQNALDGARFKLLEIINYRLPPDAPTELCATPINKPLLPFVAATGVIFSVIFACALAVVLKEGGNLF